MIKSAQFVRAQGIGNDYIVVDAASLGVKLSAQKVKLICDRHFGLGADGVLTVERSKSADFGVRVFNSDGSEAEKSGNGIRIFAKFLYEHGYTKKRDLEIETKGGVVQVKLHTEGKRVNAVTAQMGKAVINNKLKNITIEGQSIPVTALSIGNPHCVVVVRDIGEIDFYELGPLIENNRKFPKRTNVQFAEVVSRDIVRALIWERGSGHTLGSGSSACAVAVACYSRGFVKEKLLVQMEGGAVEVTIDKSLNVTLYGPVEEVCSGEFSQDFIERLETTSEKVER